MNLNKLHTLGIDIGSTTVKIAILDSENEVLFSDYERHFANIQETLSDLLGRATLQTRFNSGFSCHYRKRRSYSRKTSRSSFCTGGHCRINSSARLCTAD